MHRLACLSCWDGRQSRPAMLRVRLCEHNTGYAESHCSAEPSAETRHQHQA